MALSCRDRIPPALSDLSNGADPARAPRHASRFHRGGSGATGAVRCPNRASATSHPANPKIPPTAGVLLATETATSAAMLATQRVIAATLCCVVMVQPTNSKTARTGRAQRTTTPSWIGPQKGWSTTENGNEGQPGESLLLPPRGVKSYRWTPRGTNTSFARQSSGAR